jgi:hypothetical protein
MKNQGAPSLHSAHDIYNSDNMSQRSSDGMWTPARPLGWQGPSLYSLKQRFVLAWGVFTSKYDALKWEDR